MSKENKKTIATIVSKDCWKKLKIMSVQKEISISQLVTDILEKYGNNKKVIEETNEVS